MAISPQDLKKKVAAAGFEVYRTTAEDVILADRVRDNLIMDSGVRLRAADPLQIRLIMGMRRTQYPTDDEATLFDRVRQLAAELLSEGFVEVTTAVAPVLDPADPERTLDTYYEVTFAKDEIALESALSALSLALKVAKTAESRH